MSRLQRFIQPRLSAALTSNKLRDLRRSGLEAWRRLGRYPHQVSVWLRVDDPYAYLLLQALPTLEADFGLRISLRVLGAGSPDTTPEPERLTQFPATMPFALRAGMVSMHRHLGKRMRRTWRWLNSC